MPIHLRTFKRILDTSKVREKQIARLIEIYKHNKVIILLICFNAYRNVIIIVTFYTCLKTHLQNVKIVFSFDFI